MNSRKKARGVYDAFQPPFISKGDDIDLLNTAGEDDSDLVAITTDNVAYLIASAWSNGSNPICAPHRWIFLSAREVNA